MRGSRSSLSQIYQDRLPPLTQVRSKKRISLTPKQTPRQLTYHVVQARPEHGAGIHEVICRANGFPIGTRGCASEAEVAQMLRRFPEGQFVVVTDTPGGERVIGVALAMRTDYPPSARPLSWSAMIGDLTLPNHDPEGRWLYGVDKAVHPEFQGRGVASALYKAQFALVEALGLEGMYAGGMLKGYGRYRDVMSVREYAAKVIAGEIFDPTVSVQMKRGFKPCGVIEDYAWDSDADHAGMLIVWRPERAARAAHPAPQGLPAAGPQPSARL